MDHAQAASLLLRATRDMFDQGRPLMARVLPDGPLRLWDRYPDGGIAAPSGSRCFYHAHPPSAGDAGDHGHFHFFLPRSAMPAGAVPLRPPPNRHDDDIVHVIALGIDAAGLPTALFATNRWVTDEWLYPAEAIVTALDRFDLCGASGDRLLHVWLTAFIGLMHSEIGALLRERDAVLRAADPSGEDRTVEVTGRRPIDLPALLEGNPVTRDPAGA